MAPTTFDQTLFAELIGFGAAARRGDVLPVCIRLSNARRDAQWERRLALTRQVGPSCPPEILDRACAFMPEATEPRLLRAARSLAAANAAGCCATRAAWLAAARHDLRDAERLDPADPTARTLLADAVGEAAWSYRSTSLGETTETT